MPNGHHLVNKTKAPVTYLEIGTRAKLERAHYPEADMLFEKDGAKTEVTRSRYGFTVLAFLLFNIRGLGKA